MRHSHWLSSVIELSLVVAAALFSVVALGDEPNKPQEAKPMPPAVEPGKTFNIRVPEPGAPLPPRPGRMPHLSEFWLGLECYPAQGVLTSQLGLPEDVGLVVESVAPEGPAAKAGLQRHDILLSSGDTKLHRLDDLMKLVAENKEKPIEFKLLRAGKESTLSVQPTKRPFNHPPEGPMPFEERLNERLGQPGMPFRMRFFHPGVVVHMGEGRIPGDVSVNIHKDENGQTHIEVRKGDQNWSVTTDNMGELPGTVRGLAEQLLGGGLAELLQPRGPAPHPGPPGPGGKPLTEAPPAVVPGVPVPPPAATGPTPPGVHPPGPGAPNPRVEERLEALQRHLEQMHRELNELRNRPLPPPQNPAPPRDEPQPKSEV